MEPDGGSGAGIRRSGSRREADLVASFVDRVAEAPGVLVIEGEAGIGKTTLWSDGVARAQRAGFHVAVSRVAQAESTLSFAALGDLFHDVPEQVLALLPPPQRRALEVALLRREADERALDARAVAMACSTALGLLADEGPVLLAVDDVQWLDEPSARTLSFVLRRLHGERVGVLLTRRDGAERADPLNLEQTVPPGRLHRLAVGRLPVQLLGPLLRERLDLTLPRPLVQRIHAAAGGNPFACLEIAREVMRRGAPNPGEPLPLSEGTLHLLERRLEALPEPTIAALRVAATASRPTVGLVGLALDDETGDRVADALAVAETAGLVTVRSGDIRFAHPLFASGVAATIPAGERRDIHGRIARHHTDPEQRARHLALSDVNAVAETADALEEAARHARHRGAASTASELAVLALEHTPAADTPAQLRRRVLASTFAFDSGDGPLAHRLLEAAIHSMPPGPERALVLNQVCEISWQDTGRVERFAKQALAEAGDSPDAAAWALTSLAWVCFYRGDLAGATRHTAAAWEVVSAVPDAQIRADALVLRAAMAFAAGLPYQDELDEAVVLQGVVESGESTVGEVIYSAARVMWGLLDLWRGDLDAARGHLEKELQAYEERGRYVARDELLSYLAQVTCRAGDWEAAERFVTECLEVGEEAGHLLGRGQNLVPRAWLAALRGDLDQARADAQEGLELSLQYDDLLAVANNRGVLGFVELTDRAPARALPHLRQAVEFLRSSGVVHPGMVPFVADAQEALILTGHLDEALAIQEDDRLTGRLTDGPGSAARSARTAALLSAAAGDLPTALDLAHQAVTLPSPFAFDRARSLLVKGEIERRAKRRAQARADLTEALAAFERLGARIWAERTRGELARVTSGVAGTELSPTEARLTELVIEGKTNREAAAILFVTVKTVEANLSRIYRKLGVRSRAELVRLLVGARDPQA
jgi:DNA-binding CsgD family transcriptional regulator